MTNMEQLITNTIKTYVNGYLSAEKSLVNKAFYKETTLYTINDGKLDATTMNDWSDNLDKRKATQDIRKANLEIAFIDITGNTAMAKILLHFEKFSFTDYLSMVYLNNEWLIVGKIYS